MPFAIYAIGVLLNGEFCSTSSDPVSSMLAHLQPRLLPLLLY